MFHSMFLNVNRLRISKGNVIPRENSFLSFIYFTPIVLQIETDALRAQINRVKERVFKISCSYRFNETEMQQSKQKEVFHSFLLLFDNVFICIERFFMY